ncbi:uncharacterized protein LOC114533543 [Dendronephthya gigantea]|uniref:uncharacterized protein LOC114533543 n=1 Tax=Dendronephthya gigantea TaxID=151771 RepID=UPI00106AA6A8|nr:uncharacterized protein LOC114533543 [Dendronephthya gigantea]
MIGDVLTYIWDTISSLFNIFTFRSQQSDEESMVAKDVAGTQTNKQTRVGCEVAGKRHEKVLSEIQRDEYPLMVERLSSRYKLSETVKFKMLQLMDNDFPCGEFAMEDNNYSIVVLKRENEFDIRLFQGIIKGYTSCIGSK